MQECSGEVQVLSHDGHVVPRQNIHTFFYVAIHVKLKIYCVKSGKSLLRIVQVFSRDSVTALRSIERSEPPLINTTSIHVQRLL